MEDTRDTSMGWKKISLLENGRHWHLLEVKLHFRISHPNTLENFHKVFMSWADPRIVQGYESGT
jgi:hypothetical protein